MTIPKYLYSDVISVRRTFCNKNGYIEDITKQDNFASRGQRIVYALYTHSKKLIGTCGYESGVDRFCDYGQMVDVLTNENIHYEESTDRIYYKL